jgi:hypothetical protein
MTPAEHKQRHCELHNALNELFVDYIGHHPEKTMPTKMPLIDLINWSYSQTQEPTPPGRAGSPKHG